MPEWKLSLDYYEDAELIKMHQNCSDMSVALDEIYYEIRSEFKYGEEELSSHVEKLLENIQEKCRAHL